MSAAQYSTAAACDQVDHLATLDDIRVVQVRIDERKQQLRTENKSVEKVLHKRPEKKPEETKSLLEVIEVLSGVALASDPLVEAVFFASEGEIGDVDDGGGGGRHARTATLRSLPTCSSSLTFLPSSASPSPPSARLSWRFLSRRCAAESA